MKDVAFISDLHCGSIYGITPPEEWKAPGSEDGNGAAKIRKLQEESWTEYQRIAKKWRRPDILIVPGDCIEGKQSKQGGAEVLNTDCTVQCDMALRAIELWEPKAVYMVYGSAYHVGQNAEDFERTIAERLNDRGIPTKIEGHLFLDIEGIVFDIRHKIGTSSIPHGRATPLLRAMMWAMVKEADKTAPHVDIIIRGHAHYYLDVKTDSRRAIILPGLQLARGRFGSRECEGSISWGAMRMKIHQGKILQEDIDICTLQSNVPKVIKAK